MSVFLLYIMDSQARNVDVIQPLVTKRFLGDSHLFDLFDIEISLAVKISLHGFFYSSLLYLSRIYILKEHYLQKATEFLYRIILLNFLLIYIQFTFSLLHESSPFSNKSTNNCFYCLNFDKIKGFISFCASLNFLYVQVLHVNRLCE